VSPQLSPELVRGLLNVARSLLVAVRNWTLYPPEHPAVQSSAALASAFDDTKVAQLLATIFNSIAPDDDRKRRVLTMTRHMLSETDFGKSGQFQVLWTSAEALLISCNDSDFVSEGYRASLDHAGARAERLASAGDGRWYMQRNAAHVLGRLAAVDAVPILQPLLRKGDPRVARAAVSALGVIADPAAARAVHTIPRSATGEVRRAVIEALVADRDARVVPMLAQIVGESDVLGKDHAVVLETLTALGAVGTDAAVAPLVAAVQVTSFWRRKKARAVKQHGISALARIGSDRAKAAIDEAGKTGDRALKALAQAARV
jgi:hypothetical protein